MGYKFTGTVIERMARREDTPRGKLLADDVAVGLYLNFAKTGRVAFVRVDQAAGKWRQETIGHFPKMSIDEARAAVGSKRLEARDSDVTWAQAAEQYLSFKATKRKPLSVGAYKHLEHALNGHFAPLAKTPLAKLHRKEVSAIVLDVYSRNPETGVKLLGVARSLVRWSVAKGLIEADPLAAATRALLLPDHESVQRTRLLDDKGAKIDEIHALWNDQRPVGRVLLLQLLTGARIGETLALQPEQIDRKAKLWTKPAGNTKSDREHKIPLSPQAMRLIDESFPMAVTQEAIQHHIADSYRFRSHDCRRTCASRIREQPINATFDTSEYVLDHLLPPTARSYHRHDPVPAARVALNAWGAIVEKIGKAKTPKAKSSTKVRQ